MKQLRKNVFQALYSYIECVVEIKKEAEKTGIYDDTKLHLKQAEINKTLNTHFDEAESRTAQPKKGFLNR